MANSPVPPPIVPKEQLPEENLKAAIVEAGLLKVSDKLAICFGAVMAIILFFEERTSPLACGILLAILFGCGCYVIWHTASHLRYAKRTLTVIVLLVWFVAVVYYGFKRWPSGISIAPQFGDAYKHYKDQLGSPKANAMDVSGKTYQGVFKNATALWAATEVRYIIWNNDGKWESLNESTPPLDREWWDHDWLMRRFPPEPGYGPPEGSIAYAWDKDQHWKAMGGLETQCQSTPGVVYQTFEHGTLVGIFRGSFNTDTGIIYVLFDDHTWKYIAVRTVQNVTDVPRADASGCRSLRH